MNERTVFMNEVSEGRLEDLVDQLEEGYWLIARDCPEVISALKELQRRRSEEKWVKVSPETTLGLAVKALKRISEFSHNELDVAIATTALNAISTKGTSMSVELDHNQAKKLLEMFGGEEAHITVAKRGDDVIAYHTDYPEEGSLVLEPLHTPRS